VSEINTEKIFSIGKEIIEMLMSEISSDGGLRSYG
jgi:hypothetical protein